jgi:hypothetical protein
VFVSALAQRLKAASGIFRSSFLPSPRSAMNRAGEIDAVVFDELIRFLCVNFMAHEGRGAGWVPYLDHGATLVALRQTRRMDSRVRTQIELTLLRARLVASRLRLDDARWRGRIAMSYVRLMVTNPGVSLVMDAPGTVYAFRETDALVQNNVLVAETDFLRAVQRNVVLDMWAPPPSTPPSSDRGSDSEGDAEDAAVVPDDDAAVVPDDDAEAVPDDAALLAGVYWPEREPDEEEDLRFMDGSPLLDVVRF